MNKLEIEPVKFNGPLTTYEIFRRHYFYRHIGVSPSIDNGIRYWRVIWRPFLKYPETYFVNGKVITKFKDDNVKTLRFPVIDGVDERDLLDQAVQEACRQYRVKYKSDRNLPDVDWSMLAKATGQKIRDKYARPSLNEGTLEKAAKMFKAGASNSMVAKSLGVDRSTASRWRKKAPLN